MKKYYLFLILALAGCQHSTLPQDSFVAIQIQDRNGLTETISAPDRLVVYSDIDFLSSQPYKKVLRVFRKDGKNNSKITTYHPNGAVWQYLEAEEMRAHGTFREWYPNGQIKIDAMVIGGTADVSAGSQQDWLFNGLAQVWDEQGNILAKIPYENGLLEGVSKYYFSNHKLEKELPYKRNHLDGLAFEYYPDGSAKSKTEYSKGMKEGENIGFFPSGQIAYIETCSEGLIIKGIYYNPKGGNLSEIENGGGFQAIYNGEILSSLNEISMGRPEGKIQTFGKNGELQSVHRIKNGLKHGEEIHYYSSAEGSGHPKFSLHWFENSIHGTAKTWYPNGQLQSQREYCRNIKTGPSVAWYTDGSLMLVEEYEEDRIVKGQYFKKNQRDPVSSISNGNGVATLYDGDGIFLRKITYMKGKAIDPED